MIIIIIDITLVNYILLFHHKVVFNVCSFLQSSAEGKKSTLPLSYVLYNQVLVTCLQKNLNIQHPNITCSLVAHYCFCVSGKSLTPEKNKKKNKKTLRLLRPFLKWLKTSEM